MRDGRLDPQTIVASWAAFVVLTVIGVVAIFNNVSDDATEIEEQTQKLVAMISGGVVVLVLTIGAATALVVHALTERSEPE